MKRNIFFKLQSWKLAKNRKPLLLKGARQVGKTYVLKEFGKKEFIKTHYINFEEDEKLIRIFKPDLKPKRIIQDLSFELDTFIDINNDLIIFDEIQACPRAITSLKYFCENMPQMAICAAGSLLGVSLNSESFPVGKVSHLELYPMSFTEFLLGIEDSKSVDVFNKIKSTQDISQTVHEHLWQQLKIYFIVGGLPECVLLYRNFKDNLYTATQKVRKKQKELIEDYIKDMAKHSAKINSMHIQRVFKNIPAQLAKEIQYKKFVFKGVVPGIRGYTKIVGAIDWLCQAGLVLKVPITNRAEIPLLAYTKENRFKLYVFDIGILGALSEVSPKSILQYSYGSYKGYFAENFVAQEFASENNNLYAWNENTAEIEFLLEKNAEIIPIEVKAGYKTQAKSLKVFAQKYSPPYQIILSANLFQQDKNSKTKHFPLYWIHNFKLW